MTHRAARGSRGARDGAAEVATAVGDLVGAVADIAVALRRAETEIQAQARDRIRMLRQDAKEQLALLYGRFTEAKRLVAELATAYEGSSDSRQRAARRALTDARRVADAMIARCRRAMPE